jgi:nitrite reductase/ring-hydroxylating ferredoxin subunit
MDNRASEIDSYVDPDRIADRLKRLTPGAAVTSSGVEFLSESRLEDNEWGVFDLIHRVHVHNTYDNFIPLISSRDISILVTRFGRLPLLFQVMAARLRPGVYYQSFSVLGILYCHQVTWMTQEDAKTRVKITWYLVSHRIFKFLHSLFSWRLRKLQETQNGEDAPLRKRRLELRGRGVTFVTDSPDFTNANDLGDHVILPKQTWPIHNKLPGLKDQQTAHVRLGPFELLLHKDGDHLLVWPGLCPHEGALLDESHRCGDQLSCPWHGRKFRAVRLKQGEGVLRYLGLSISIQNDELIAAPEPFGR